MQLVLAALRRFQLSLRFLQVFKCWEGIITQMMLNCGEETARSFMLAFIRGISNEMYSAYVYVPEGEELDSVKGAGLPGCVGSMDCTPVLWDRAAKKIANQCR